jgi:hypothetical protein
MITVETIPATGVMKEMSEGGAFKYDIFDIL